MNEVKMVGKHFSGLPGFSSVSFEQEFPLFKNFVMRSLASNSSNIADLSGIMILGHHESFPNIAVLAKVALALPVSTIEVERGFSQQNLIKTRTRTRLLPQNLDLLMKIVIKGLSINEMDFGTACELRGENVSRKCITQFHHKQKLSSRYLI